ncbi:MAG: type II toxin-antitoxin system death-on-curing family toxin [Gammaproteobacteria bacterium]|nr:type II toxin-antitoxin system death-on-curing family toxin [Gammaproteobacteria bacterium]
MLAPHWISEELILAVHDRQIAEHGGPAGVRDQAMLESALTRPQQRLAYGGTDVDLPALAAAYAVGIARNHPFVDGNKRTAAVACELFLELNVYLLVATDPDMYPVIYGLAAGEISEEELTLWLRENCRPGSVSESGAGYG